jgi:hypothetical protein
MEATRAVSGPLKLGLVFLPYLSAWFLLGKGYSAKARMWGFGWAAVVVLIAIVVGSGDAGAAVTGPAT